VAAVTQVRILVTAPIIPYSLVVRIPGSHPGDPGSIPGMGKWIYLFNFI
jgi:hypothetical protein